VDKKKGAKGADALSVLVVTNMYPTPESPHYGTFVAEQVDALRARDDIERVDVLFVDGREKPSNYFRALRQVRRAVKEHDYDVVHAHHGLAGAVAVAQRSVPVVITYHGSELGFYPWQRAVSRNAARLAAANVCVSNRHLDKVPGRAFYVPCGIDLGVFGPRDRAEARKRLGVPEGALALLFPSRRDHPQKAYARFEEIRDALRAKGRVVHELRLENTARRDVPDLFAAADAMVLTSVSEGSPVSVMEALACGTPVVATDVGDVRSMLEGVPGTFVADYDRDRFVEAIESLRDSERRTAGRAARFSQDRVVAALRDVYVEAVER
jgi:teichuronic acid biosynthesis glycosyltransferase TuaC